MVGANYHRPVRFTVPASEYPELSIVVMFTHDPSLAERCIDSIERVAGELPATETIFLLGGSPAAVREIVAAAAGARLIDSPVNLGTAVGWQLGFNAARGRHVLLMHEDAALTPGLAPSLIATLDADPAAGAVGPWLVENAGDEPRNCGWVWFRDQSQTALTRKHLPPGFDAAPYAVDRISSAISLWDRNCWIEGGGFDERNFPALGVDTDSCTSIWARGRSVLVDPRVTGIHRGGAMDEAPGRLSGRLARYFMLDRHKRVWSEKWMAMADWYAQPPLASQAEMPEAAALAETQRRRRELPRMPGDFPWPLHTFTDPDGSGRTPSAVDQRLVQDLSAALETVKDEYHLWLINHSETQQAEIEHLSEAIRTMSAREAVTIADRDRLLAFHEANAAIASSRAHRLLERMLVPLRGLRRKGHPTPPV